MQRLQRLLAGGLLLSSLSVSALAASTMPQVTRVPLIVPQLLSVVEQKKCVKETEHEFCAEIRIDLETTAVPWLDSILLARLDLSNDKSKEAATDIQAQLRLIEQQSIAWLAESYDEIKQGRQLAEPAIIAYEHQDSLRFIAQRNHLASFKQFSYAYSGGAHGMSNISYLLLDLNAQRQSLLADIVQQSADQKLLEKLRELYQEQYADYAETWLSENPAEQAETFLTDNFVFNDQGLTFSYPAYVLGPYSAGEVRLTLTYTELKDILKPEYLLD